MRCGCRTPDSITRGQALTPVSTGAGSMWRRGGGSPARPSSSTPVRGVSPLSRGRAGGCRIHCTRTWPSMPSNRPFMSAVRRVKDSSPPRPGRAVSLAALHRAPRTEGHRALGGKRGRLLRQRAGRVHHRAVPGGTHLSFPRKRESIPVPRRARERVRGSGRMLPETRPKTRPSPETRVPGDPTGDPQHRSEGPLGRPERRCDRGPMTTRQRGAGGDSDPPGYGTSCTGVLRYECGQCPLHDPGRRRRS